MELKEKIERMMVDVMKSVEPLNVRDVCGNDVIVAKENALNALKQMKCHIVNAEKSGKDFDEMAVIRRLKKQHEDSIEIYSTAGRDDLLGIETDELSVINLFLPEDVSDETIASEVDRIVDGMRKERDVTMCDVGRIISEVRSLYPSADGKTVSEAVKRKLK